MISLKRNSKGETVPALGLRTRSSSIYSPGQDETFRISRTKFNDFLSCRRCFYLDRVKGVVSPSTPGWSLNATTDDLLKREFDACRELGFAHRSFQGHGLGHIVPFQHPDLDHWRNSLRGGLEHRVAGTNIVLHGGVDDVWYDPVEEEVIVVDYKSQANSRPVTTEDYLSYVYHQAYKVQLDVYAYLLEGMGFSVSPTGYFYVCNADRDAEGFHGRLEFQETLVPYNWNADWVEPEVFEMASVLDSHQIPEGNPACENCAYSRQRAMLEGGEAEPAEV